MPSDPAQGQLAKKIGYFNPKAVISAVAWAVGIAATRCCPVSLLFHIARDLLGSREPDAWLAFHVPNQLIEIDDARPHADDVRVKRQDHHRPFLVRHVEI